MALFAPALDLLSARLPEALSFDIESRDWVLPDMPLEPDVVPAAPGAVVEPDMLGERSLGEVTRPPVA
jgi:hypothetical protein